MRRNQNGVSMITLVITIIVIIILAAVAFSGSMDTISNATWSGFVTDIDSVRTAFSTEGIPNLVGEESANQNTVTNAQAFNYLAKGATRKAIQDSGELAQKVWLTKSLADAMPCTRIEPEYAKEVLGIELPSREVNTYDGTNIQVSYFVTNKGDIFVWPPYEYEDTYWVNDKVQVTKSGDTTPLTTAREAEMYPTAANGTFTFSVNGVDITVLNAASRATTSPVVGKYSAATLKAEPSIFYTDAIGADSPEGIETDAMYTQVGTAMIPTTTYGHNEAND